MDIKVNCIHFEEDDGSCELSKERCNHLEHYTCFYEKPVPVEQKLVKIRQKGANGK
jgi:hypothetical protein